MLEVTIGQTIRRLLSCFFVLSITTAFCQVDYSRDSIQNLLSSAKSDVERFTITLHLSENIYTSNPVQALEYASELVQLGTRLNNDSLLFRAYLHQGNIYQQLGNYPRSLQLYHTAISYAQKINNETYLARAYGNIGNIYYFQKDYTNALRYYHDAVALLSEPKSTLDKRQVASKARLLNNLGIISDETRKFDDAGQYYKEALELAQEVDDHVLIANVLNNQGTLYRDQGKYELAYEQFYKAMEVRKKNNNTFGLARSYNNIGQFYYEQLDDYQKAEDFLNNALALGKELNSLPTINAALENLYLLYEKKGDYKKAFEALTQYRQTHDSLYNQESTIKIAQLEMQFAFDKKQAEAVALQKERELNYLLTGGGLFSLLAIVTLLYFLQRSRTKRSELQQAHLQLEKVNLKKDLAARDKELAANIMYLINKNELINTISEKLLEIKKNMASESQFAVQKVVLDLQSNLQPELWQEFEYRFQQVHEDFYRKLNEKFPDLTPSERRLCAFLKLNMTTKEISSITHQNAKSIDVARTRLRKKLDLTGTDHNLVSFLAGLGNPEKEL